MPWTVLILGYLAWLGVMSVATFMMFAWDKRRAKKHGWRVSEKTLHTLELLGGWPGAWLAMRWLRHKSSKHSYRRAWVGIVMLHILGVGLVLYGFATGWGS